mmetsp:Transcript_15722/g.32787  ORF Transcript_15722/g.32787 Transcript_15722/m.32787 type:complete len:118 (+) Transcript_15722:233-586(+)
MDSPFYFIKNDDSKVICKLPTFLLATYSLNATFSQLPTRLVFASLHSPPEPVFSTLESPVIFSAHMFHQSLPTSLSSFVCILKLKPSKHDILLTAYYTPQQMIQISEPSPLHVCPLW